MKRSDTVAAYILNLLEENGTAEFCRNELANCLGCVPSQINYVIASRFTPENGYLTESRRGGGGYIRITRVTEEPHSVFLQVLNSAGVSLDNTACKILLENMVQRGLIPTPAANLIEAAVSDQSLAAVPQEYRDKARAGIFKNMLLKFISCL